MSESTVSRREPAEAPSLQFSWVWRSFDELSVEDLYAILALRAEVFVVEQECAFQDVDGLDPRCQHLLGISVDKLLAYARVLPDGVWRSGAVSIGRIVSSPSVRRRGVGFEIVTRALDYLKATCNSLPI